MMENQELLQQPYYAGGCLPQNIQAEKEVMIGEKLEKMLNNFKVFGFGCILYGIIFTICLYNGFSGISMPALSAITMGMLVWGLHHLNIEVKKNTRFYFIAWETLAISNCLTGSGVLIFFNTCGMALLFMSFLLTHFCKTTKWGFGKYLLEIFLIPFVSLSYIGYPFKALRKYFSDREKKKSSVAKYIWLGIFIAIPFLFVIIALLTSADVVFRNLFQDLFKNIHFPERPFYFGFLLVTGIIGSYSLLAYFADGQIKDEVNEKSKWEPIIGISFLSLITVVYLIFSVIQISYLFLESFELPNGYSHATYAREGFFQLLFVCLINLTIILICVSRFRENIFLKIIMTVFSGCTYIMIASSAMRMILYIREYQLTFLRLLVLWALAVIAISFIACMITIYKKEFPLFQYTMIVVTVCYIIFSLAKPDYIIAKYNLTNGAAKMLENEEYSVSNHDLASMVDLCYLADLSSDALPALEEAGILSSIIEGNSNFYENRVIEKWEKYEDMGILAFNFSYYRASRILADY